MSTTLAQWDERFMNLARSIATWSKDRSRQVGCVIIGPAKEIRAMGYNGFPRGVDDEVAARHERPAKYWWTEHAERNAIYNCARSGVSTFNCTLYLPWWPCMDCARAIVQSGIAAVVGVEPDWNDPKYGPEFREVATMFEEARPPVKWRVIPGAAPQQVVKATIGEEVQLGGGFYAFKRPDGQLDLQCEVNENLEHWREQATVDQKTFFAAIRRLDA